MQAIIYIFSKVIYITGDFNAGNNLHIQRITVFSFSLMFFKTLTQIFPCKFCKISNKTFSYKTSPSTFLLQDLNIVSQATFGYLPPTVQYLCDLQDAMPRRWLPVTFYLTRECSQAFFKSHTLLLFSRFPQEPAVQPQDQQGFMLIFKMQPWPDYLFKSQQSTKDFCVVGFI